MARNVGVVLITAELPRFQVRRNQRALVVEHFFKVRNQPLAIHRVAREATAEPVIHAARRHLAQREQRHFLGVAPSFGAWMPLCRRQQEANLLCAWEFGSLAEAAVDVVKGGADRSHPALFGGGELFSTHQAGIFAKVLKFNGQRFGQRIGRRQNLIFARAPGLIQLCEHL